MAVKVNLLPEDLAVKKGTAKIAKLFKSLTTISLVVALVVGVGLLIFFLVSYFQLKGLESNIADVEAQVKAQETTEQRVVLLKDRLTKIKQIQAIEDASKPIEDISPFLNTLPVEASLGEFDVDSDKIDASFRFASSTSLNDFFTSLLDFDAFPRATLTSFGFNPNNGYLVGVRFFVKN